MCSDVALVDFCILLFKVSTDKVCWVVSTVEEFEVETNVDTGDTVELVAVSLHELANIVGSVVVIAGSVDETQVAFFGGVQALVACGVGVPADFDEWVSLLVADGEHFFVYTSAVTSFVDEQPAGPKVRWVVWKTDWLESVNFEPVEITAAYWFSHKPGNV